MSTSFLLPCVYLIRNWSFLSGDLCTEVIASTGTKPVGFPQLFSAVFSSLYQHQYHFREISVSPFFAALHVHASGQANLQKICYWGFLFLKLEEENLGHSIQMIFSKFGHCSEFRVFSLENIENF